MNVYKLFLIFHNHFLVFYGNRSVLKRWNKVTATSMRNVYFFEHNLRVVSLLLPSQLKSLRIKLHLSKIRFLLTCRFKSIKFNFPSLFFHRFGCFLAFFGNKLVKNRFMPAVFYALLVKYWSSVIWEKFIA